MLKITHSKARLTHKRKSCLLAAQFHACQLGIDKLPETIHIVFQKGFLRETGQFANCGPEDGQLTINIDDSLNYQVTQSTIAHEMVHAKQWLTGELGLTKSNNFRWQGRRVSSKIPYHKSPWEVEAMSREIIMTHEFAYFLEKLGA